jgi:hypothetical protein
MDVGASFVADGEATKAVKPGERALHDPAVASEPLARLDAPPCDARDDGKPSRVPLSPQVARASRGRAHAAAAP